MVWLAVVFLLSGCVSTSEPVGPDPDAPVFHLENYDFNPESSLIDRVTPIPPHVHRFMEELDGRRYSNYNPTGAETEMIERYLSLLPPRQQRVLKDRLVGMYFLEPFLGGGFTEYVLSEDDEIYTFIVFNALTLHLDLSQWITYRENTVFGPGTGERLRADCGTEFTGFMHVLLHEATHVVDYVEGTATWMRSFVPAGSRERDEPDPENGFIAGVWQEPYQPVPGADYALRRQIAYYGMNRGPHLEISQAAEAYRQLTESPFVSLYASTAAWEDLAELVTWHHLTEVLGQPHRIVLSWPDLPDRTIEFRPDPETEERREMLQTFYH